VTFQQTTLAPHTFSSIHHITHLLLHRPPSLPPSSQFSRRISTRSISPIFRLTILPIVRHVPHPVPPILSGDGCLFAWFAQFQQATFHLPSHPFPLPSIRLFSYLPGRLVPPSHPLLPLPVLHQRQLSMALQFLCPTLSSMPLSFLIFHLASSRSTCRTQL